MPKFREIITVLYAHGFIVNNICGDGATENNSTFKQLATMTVRDVSGTDHKNYKSTAHESINFSLLDNIPNEKLPILFPHPYDNTIKIFIVGEMPHWIKKLVN